MLTTDLHSHILPGVDDGPQSLEDSLEMARAYVAAGTGRVVSTPHVNHRWGVRIETVREARASLIEALEAESIALIVEPGGEIALSTAIDLSREELDSFRLAGGDWLLIEPPASGPSVSVHGMIFEIQARGYRVILAHPERCETFQKDVDLLDSLVAGGIRTQVTATALNGRFGSSAQKASREFFERNLVHMVASDAHDTINRPPGMEVDLEMAGYAWLTQWLCVTMPAVVLDSAAELPRPSRPESASRLGRLFGRRG